MTERSVFLAALDIDDPAARAAYLDEACAGEPALRRRVEDLLAAAAASGTFMAQPAADRVPPDVTAGFEAAGPGRPAAAVAGTVLADRYVLGDEIGSGGMGTVYRAEQVAPVRRPVAVKLINPGMDSRSVLARFEAERQALALMDHPHIATVLDAGATPDGRPFFVMELVHGVPLTDYCDARKLPVADRLDLFRQVCGAVQHAHQKGVIHRDLKPSNILVEDHPGGPVPKVIDFGLAKAVGGVALTAETLLTAPGTVAGTPLYMAPEQASFGAVDTDTRADVYALGAVLYELLTGSTPIRRDTLKQAALDELLRVIREDEPPAPSRRIGSSDALPSVAANRRTEPGRLGRFVRGDLDWVVMKALEKDRGRRYESAAAFAADIDRFLNHKPVAAGPPTAAYRVRKFVRRNRAAVTAAGLVLLALVGGVIGTTWGLVQAEQAREAADIARSAEADRAEGERRAKEAAQDAAAAERAAKLSAERRLDQLGKSNGALASIFVDLDPFEVEEDGRSLRLTLAGRLEEVARQLNTDAVGDPLTMAKLQNSLGVSLQGLGQPAKAIPLYEQAVATSAALSGDDNPDTLKFRLHLASAYLAGGRLDLAVPLFERTLKALEALRGDDHPQTLTTRGGLAGAYRAAGRLDLAVPLHERTLKALEALRGGDHPDTLDARTLLAEAYRFAGRPALAVPLLEPTLTALEARYGGDHPRTLGCRNILGIAYLSTGKFDRAVPLLERNLAGRVARLGDDHPATLHSRGNLALAYKAAGRLDLAVPLHERILAVSEAKFGGDHPDTLTARNNMAQTYQDTGRLDLAVPLFERTLPALAAKLGGDHPNTRSTRSNLANAYRAAGRPDRAIPLHMQNLKLLEARVGDAPAEVVMACGFLAGSYVEAGRPAEALPLFGRYIDGVRKEHGAGSPVLGQMLAEVSAALLDAGQFAAAEPYLRECLAIREKAMPDAWRAFNTRSSLGGSLLGQRKYADAEPLLVAGYEGLKAREETIPPDSRSNLSAAADRLVTLYVALGRPAEVTTWRAERAKYPPEQAPPPRARR